MASRAATEQRLGLATTDDLLLLTRGFSAALTGHHHGEDQTLFPAVAAARPELGPVLRRLRQDHAVIAGLLDDLRAATDGAAPLEHVPRRLATVAAVMEDHFHDEERQLHDVLDTLQLADEPGVALGPL